MQLQKKQVLQFFASKWENSGAESDDNSLMDEETKTIYLALLNVQRDLLLKKNKSLVVDEEIVRRHLLYLDLEEEKLGLL